MRKTTIILLLLAFLSANAERKAYVVNTLAETLSSIDLQTGQVENHIVTLGEAPNQVAYHDNFLYIINSVSADIMKVDPETHQVVADIYLPVGSNPYYAAFDGNFCYVTGFVSGAVYKINVTTNDIERTGEVGGFPEGVLVDEGYVYVTKTNFNPDDFSYGQGTVTVLDIDSLDEMEEVDVGTNPQWISLGRDGLLQVVCTGNYVDIEGSVYMLDPSTRTVVDSVNIGGQPANLAVSPLGIGYLSAGGWIDNGYIYSYDLETGEIINGPGNPILSGLGVTNVAVDSLGYLYSCDMGDDTVSRFSPSGEFLSAYSVGDGPIFMTVVDDAILDIESDSRNSIPDAFAVLDNYPNPFNGGTSITFEIVSDEVTLREICIYNVLGERVKTVRLGTTGSSGAVYWDGKDDLGTDCSSGIYFAAAEVISSPGGDRLVGASHKMLLIK